MTHPDVARCARDIVRLVMLLRKMDDSADTEDDFLSFVAEMMAEPTPQRLFEFIMVLGKLCDRLVFEGTNDAVAAFLDQFGNRHR